MFQNPLNSQVIVLLLPEMSPLDPLGPSSALVLLPLLPPLHAGFSVQTLLGMQLRFLCFSGHSDMKAVGPQQEESLSEKGRRQEGHSWDSLKSP